MTNTSIPAGFMYWLRENPIDPGFPWAQALAFGVDVLQPSDSFRADFYREPRRSAPIAALSTGAGIRIAGNLVYLSLTSAQTAPMDQGAAVTNLVLKRAGVEIPIAAIIGIPIVVMPTRPKP